MKTLSTLTLFTCVSASAMLSGCSMFDRTESGSVASSTPMTVIDIKSADRKQLMPEQAQPDEVDNFGALGQPQLYSSVQGAYKGRPLTKHVGDYVKNMAQDLISNMEYVTNETAIAVTNFAPLDSELNETNLLGRQMAESFIHELHKFRIPVIDFKATDFIRITDTGDFVLSRDYLELDARAPIDYVLTGTMTKHQGGVLVNARILGMRSHAVVATAQMLVPFYVVDALIPSGSSHRDGAKDGVRLSRG